MYRLYFVIFLLLLICNSYGQQYHFNNYSIQEGLAQSGIYCIYQDRRGNLWIGTEDGGLSIFNGMEFTTLSTDQGLSGNIVRDVIEDAGGNIWIATQDGGITIYNGNEYSYINAINGLKTNHIRTLCAVDNGGVWVGTYGQGALLIKNGQITTLDSLGGLSNNIVRDIIYTADKKIWFATDNGVNVFDGKNIQVINEEQGLPSSKIISLYEDSQNRMWIGTNNGLCLYVDTLIKVFNQEQGLLHNRVKSVLEDQHGDFWFGTRTGLNSLDANDVLSENPTFHSFTKKNGLINNRIRCLLEDKSGSIWIGTYFGGLSQFYDRSFVKMTEENGLSSNYVSALYADSNTLFVGSLEEGLNIIDPHTFKASLRKFHGLESINAIAIDSKGSVWIGTAKNGLFVVRDGRLIHHIDESNGLVNQEITSIVVDKLDQVWVGNSYGVAKISVIGNNPYADHIVMDNVKGEGNKVNHLAFDTNGNLWVATNRGLRKLAADQVNAVLPTVTSFEELDQIMISSLATDVFGNVWLGSNRNGLYKYDGSTFTNYRKDLGFCSNMVNQIMVYDSSTIWVGSNKCIYEITLDFDQEPIEIRNFGVDEGYFEIEPTKNTMVKHGEMVLFGSLKGLMHYTPSKDIKISSSPKLNINDVRLNSEKITWSDRNVVTESFSNLPINLILPYNDNHLSFDFHGVSLSAPDKVRYIYILQGHDNEWSKETYQRFIPYTNIPPGDYTFKVLSCSADNVWNPTPASFSFTITPPIWDTWPFRISAILAGILILIGIIKWRTKVLRDEKINLERIVKERTKELVIEKDKSDNLLLNILPAETATELKNNGYAKTKHYDNASVLFTDFAGFTYFSSELHPEDLVRYLNDCFKAFDDIMEKYDLEKIKTIGDSYMCAGGIPIETYDHYVKITQAGLDMIEAMKNFNNNILSEGLTKWNIRVGINCGPIVAGVVGKKKFAYDIWGDTVNVASRMESNSEPNKLNVSQAMYEKINGNFKCSFRGKLDAKNKGEVEMYFVKPL